MNLKFLIVSLLILFLSSSISAFTPLPCRTVEDCDCSIEFCTYPQAREYLDTAKFKNLLDIPGAFGKSFTYLIYIYGSFPTSWEGKTIFKTDTFYYKGFQTMENIGLENVKGFHQYKVKVDPSWGWDKVKLPGGYTVPIPSDRKGTTYTFSVYDKVNHVGDIKASPSLENAFKNACDGWSGKLVPLPCIDLFSIGDPTIRRKVYGTISPIGSVGGVYVTNTAGTSIPGAINSSTGKFEVSPLEPGLTYKLSVVIKQGSGYLNWAEDIAIPTGEDLQKNIVLQGNPTAAQGMGKGALKIELVSANGAEIAGTVSYNIFTNPNKIETVSVPAAGLTKSDLPAGDYKFTITPADQKYVPNPQTIYQFSIKSNITNVLKVTFDETDESPPDKPPAGAKTGNVMVPFADWISQLKGKVSNPIVEINNALTVTEGGTNRSISHDVSGESFIILKEVKVGGKYTLSVASIKVGNRYVRAFSGTTDPIAENNLIIGGS